MNRSDMIRKLTWSDDMWGYKTVNNGILTAYRNESRFKDVDEPKSVVIVLAPPYMYSDGELEKLVQFSDEMTASYDARWITRRGANMNVIGKWGEAWWRIRQTWREGRFTSLTLDEALEVLR